MICFLGRALLALTATALLASAAAGTAVARGPANQFAVGSAKTDVNMVIMTDAEHASFSAHSSGMGCGATGHIVYKNMTMALAFEANINVLVIDPMTNSAFFGGVITNVSQGSPDLVGDVADFDAHDSGLPGGKGDTFLFEGPAGLPLSFCATPLLGHPITSGNIVIKTGS